MIFMNILTRGIATAFCILLISSHLCAQGTQDENAHYELATRIFKDGLYADAAREYKQFIINFPTSKRLPDAMLRVGQAYARAEQYDLALEALQQFIDRYATHIEVATAMRTRANALRQLGEHTRAGGAYREVHAAYPASTNAPQDLLSAGENYHKGGALSEAGAAYRQLVEQYPKSSLINEATFNLGRVLLEESRTEEALAQFRTLSERPGPAKHKPDALLEMGNIALSRDNLPEAERIFANLRARYPTTPAAQNSHLITGAWHARKNDWASAEKTYNNALATIPNNTRRQQALLGSANAKRKLGKSESARQRYAAFLRTYPKSPFHAHALIGYGRAFADLKNYRNALDAFKNLQEKYPDTDISIQAYGDIGNIWRALGTHQKALSAYQTYLTRIQSPGEKARARLLIAQICEDLHWHDLAAENYRTLIDSASAHYASEGQYGLARVFEKTGEPALALREYRTYIKNHGDAARAETAETRIQLLTEYGTETDRDRTYIELLANLPGIADDAHTQLKLGKTFYNQKHYNRAITHLETALTIQGIPPSAYEHILVEPSNETPENTPATTPDDTLALAAEAARAAEAILALADGRAQEDLPASANDDTVADTPPSADTSDETFNNAPPWVPEAYYLLGNSYLKQARRATLENKSPDQWQDRGLTTLKILIQKFPDNDHTKDAALTVIHTETAHIQPDTLRAQTRLSAYRAYSKTHANSPDLLLRIADAHFSNTHIDSALSLYLQVQKKSDNPTHSEKATYGIGLCQAQQQQHARAEETLKNFLFNYPQSDLTSHAQFQLGRILLDREFYASAAEAFSELLSASPSLALQRSARDLLAESHHRLGNYQRAIEIDESLITHNTTPQLLRRLAESYAQNNQRDKAVTTYNMYLRKYPQAPDADSIAYTRAEHLSYLNRTSEALTAFREFSKKYPNSPLGTQADQAVGDLLYQTEKYAQAIAAYQRVPEPARNETMAAREVLSLYRLRRVGEANKAAGQFKKTYKTATEWIARFEVEKGRYQLAVKNPKKARQIFQDIAKKYARTEAEADARYYIIRAYRDEGPDKDGNNDPYLNALTTFIKNYPDSPHWVDANLELAAFWERNEEYNLSARAYRNAIEKGVAKSEKPGILHKLAKNYSNLNAYDLAINFARQLIREFPQDRLALDARIDIGTIYLPNKGAHEQAIAELRPLLKLVTEENEKANIQYAIAENYFEMADYANALREFLIMRYNQNAGVMWIVSAQMKVAECYAAQNNIEQALQELEAIKRSHGVASMYGIGAEKLIQQIKAQRQ
ncbi:MAG: tetratricopeptide repeat protein [Gemmatimonadetes bacterium]|nr:tetratricopeptide repeat protein [Gemmatimonadota bacterium]